METKGKEISVWTLLNRWLNDGSKSSKMPKELISDKSIGPQYILYYFKDSIYNIWFNEHFNNFGIYQIDRIDMIKFLKQCVLDTGYKPPFLPRYKNTKTKISVILKKKYPYFKMDDINLLVKEIDSSEECKQIYETLGLHKPKKTKTNAANKKKLKKINDKQSDPPESNPPVKIDDDLHNFMKGLEIE